MTTSIRACRSTEVIASVLALLAVVPAASLAQPGRTPEAYTVRGPGPVTYVFISGLMGGPAGFRRVQTPLLERGYRVVVVDPYRLSVDSAEVSFDALARRVERLLVSLGVDSAYVVGHAHGGGVALRLAARAPWLVRELYLIDAGAVPQNRTRVFSASLRLVPMITRIPGGRSFVRWHLVRGLRQHSGSTDWLDRATERAYTEPVLDNISRVLRMAERLASASEPEPVDSVLARMRAPVRVILSGIEHAAAPDSAEMAGLRRLGELVTIVTIEGVGHFPHEEVPARVAAIITAARDER